MNKEQNFKEKWQKWRKCYSDDDNHSRYSSGGDVNSISNQITSMLWDAAVWNIINKSRTFAGKNSDRSLQVNGMIHNFIDRCFFESQMISIRRLVYGKSIDGKKGEYSFSTLIKDMKKHIELITRGNILKAENLSDAIAIESREKSLDKFCGVKKNSRSPGDVVKKELLENAESMVKKASRNIIKYVNSFIAHSATPDSQRKPYPIDHQVTLNELYNAHRIICKTATFIGRLLDGYVMYRRLPTSIWDELEYIDLPLVDSKNVNDLQTEWETFEKKTEEWCELDNEFFK